MLGLRKPKHAGKTHEYGFKCLTCINHQARFDTIDESLEYANQHNKIYHYGEGN